MAENTLPGRPGGPELADWRRSPAGYHSKHIAIHLRQYRVVCRTSCALLGAKQLLAPLAIDGHLTFFFSRRY
jgi:hypothetical protein